MEEISLPIKAYEIARHAHEGQVDKEGKPYINHPVAVAEMMHAENEKTTAYLHDVIEDTSLTLDDLRTLGIPEDVVNAVNAITKRDGEEYGDYLMRVKANEIACKVKIADLNHNTSPSRKGATPRMLEKYKHAKEFLLS